MIKSSAVLLAATLGVASCMVPPPTPLKTISYNGGVVEFQLPADWNEGYEEDGGGVFWGPKEPTGTLRLDLISARKDLGGREGSALDLLKGREGELRSLPSGNAILEHTHRAVEEGTTIVIRFWEVGNYLPPDHYRVALFSHTVLESQENEPIVLEEVYLLRRLVSAARFSSTIGTTR